MRACGLARCRRRCAIDSLRQNVVVSKIVGRMKKSFYSCTILLSCLVLVTSCRDEDDPFESGGTVGLEWTLTKGPDGGHVPTLVSIDNKILAGSVYGIYMSEDDGESWKLVAPQEFAYCIVASNNNMIAATSSGLLISQDGGDSWDYVSTKFGSIPLGSIPRALLPTEDGLIGGFSDVGVYYTSDNGKNWISLNDGLTNPAVTRLAVNGTRIFAGTEGGGVFVSDNGGQTWASSNTGLTNLKINQLLVHDDHVFAGTEQGLFVSADGGSSWEATPLTDQFIIDAKGNGNDILVATRDGLQRITRSGSDWILHNDGLDYIELVALLVKDDKIFGSGYDGVLVSLDNGQSWQRRNSGLLAKTVKSIGLLSGNLYAGTDNGLLVSGDNGDHWTVAHSETSDARITALAVHDGTIFQSGDLESFVSRDGGVTWSKITALSHIDVTSFTFAGENVIYAGSSHGVHVSVDGGNGWTKLNDGLNYVTCISVKGDHLFAGTALNGIYRSSDGEEWIQVNNGLAGPVQLMINSMVMAGSSLVAGTGDGIFISSDNGNTWSKSLKDVYVNSLAVGRKVIIAGTHKGVYVSTDEGRSWALENQGLHEYTQVRSVAIENGKMAIGAQGGGVYISYLPAMWQ